MTGLSFANMGALCGTVLGRSDWVTITQDRVNAFASCTGDTQWIHTDAARAARESPFGGAVAHGYLTLSLLSPLAQEIGVLPSGTETAIHCGLDRVRFSAPVPVGARLRLEVGLISFKRQKDGRYLMKTANRMEMEGHAAPVLQADSLALLIPGADAVV